jgi:hypothetical protein
MIENVKESIKEMNLVKVQLLNVIQSNRNVRGRFLIEGDSKNSLIMNELFGIW